MIFLAVEVHGKTFIKKSWAEQIRPGCGLVKISITIFFRKLNNSINIFPPTSVITEYIFSPTSGNPSLFKTGHQNLTGHILMKRHLRLPRVFGPLNSL